MDLEGRSAPDAYGVGTGQVEREWSVWDIDPDEPMTPLRAERQRVAATLGEVLRRAFVQHMEACGCGTRIAVDRCPEGLRLCLLRPDGDQIYLA